jgi:hypothetical protein
MMTESYKPCTHLGDIKPQARVVVVEADHRLPFGDRTVVCEDCIAEGYVKGWVHLRQCMVCGHVACCNSSDNKHASRHAHSQGHHIIRSVEPSEHWGWCYIDSVELEMNPYPHVDVVLV